MKEHLTCPACGAVVDKYVNPIPAVDVIVELEGRGVVLVERRNPPHGWALPGGFVDYGESLEQAARREAEEEISLKVEDLRQFRAYSDPARDPRHHTISVVFIARAKGEPRGGDDARRTEVFPLDELPDNIVFDHATILNDYKQFKEGLDSGADQSTPA